MFPKRLNQHLGLIIQIPLGDERRNSLGVRIRNYQQEQRWLPGVELKSKSIATMPSIKKEKPARDRIQRFYKALGNSVIVLVA